MPRQPENTFIASIHRLLPTDVYRQKNHNPYNSGIPDCWYSGGGGDLWIEYKYVELPKRDATVIPVNLSDLQQAWLQRRHAEGRNVGVIVGCSRGGVWFPGVDWTHAITNSEFCFRLLPRQQLAEVIQTKTMIAS